MQVKQIYEILNGAMKQVYGEETITATDLTGLVSEGNKLIADAGADIFDKLAYGLLDRVYKMVLGVRRYTPSDSNIIRDYETYGAILEKVYYDPINAVENKTWALADGTTIDPFSVSLVKTKVKIFSDKTTWEVPFTITEKQIKTAFLNSGEMSIFISGLFDIAENSMSAQVEKVAEFARANFIGEKIAYDGESDKKGIPVVKLITNYNAIVPEAERVTADNALYNKEFLRYASAEVRKWQKKLTKYSTLFNNEQFKRFTPTENQRLTFISDFIQQMETYLQSDTFHDEIVKLPQYTELPYWQGSGELYSTADCMKINITTSSGQVVSAAGIIGMIADEDAMGITIWNERTTNQYNGHGEYTNYWRKADVGLWNDLSENAIIFQLA